MQAYEAYVENGNVYPIGKILNVPERKRAIITIMDESVTNVNQMKTPQERREAWARMKELCKDVNPNIDEKAELAEAREEKYGRID